MVSGTEAVVYEGSLQGARGVGTHVKLMAPHGAHGSRAVLRILLVAVPVVLAGYALDDRGFAYLAAVPGTPIFAGEMILLLGGAFVALATGYLRLALRNSLPMVILLAFAGWGLARTLPLIPLYGIDSARDAALWYYAFMAVLVATLVVAVPDLPGRWARAYVPFVVVLLLWSPIGAALNASGEPAIPWSGVPFFSHHPGNTAVSAVTALAFLWLVPMHSLGTRARALLTGLATLDIVVASTQTRGGFVAAVAGLLLLGALLGRRRWNMTAIMVGTVLVSFVLAWGLDVHVLGTGQRDYSVAQLIQNVASIPAGQNSAELGGTVAFRDQLWSGVLNLAIERGALATGLGFGPNLAQELGDATVGAGEPLRSPHNSHIDILARMGIVGAVLWLAFWASWYAVMLRRSAPASRLLSPERRGLVKVCMVGVAATLVNAYFDPTLESPQVAIWLWTLAGLGLGIALKGTLPNRSTTVLGTRS